MGRFVEQLHPLTHQILGVWTEIDGKLQSEYVPAATSYQIQIGSETMNERNPGVPWDRWALGLSRRTPALIWWVTDIAPDIEPLRQTLIRVVLEQG